MAVKLSTVLITGASYGIGKACAEAFAAQGANLILSARSADKLKQQADELQNKYQIRVHVMPVDLQQLDAVNQAIDQLPAAFQRIDVLVNNAGLALGLDKIQDGNPDDWTQMLDTNVKGLLYVTRKVLQGMLKEKHGHIINVASASAYEVYPGGAVYCATKFAVRALSKGTKMDVHGTPIRVSQVDPGLVETNFSMTRFAGDHDKAKNVYAGMTPLTAEDVADAVLYCATRPAHVDVRVLKIFPTDQTASHMVHRVE